MAALAASLELWSAERKFENFLDRTSTQGQFNKDSVKIVIESHYLLSNVDFHSEIRFEKFLHFKREILPFFLVADEDVNAKETSVLQQPSARGKLGVI